MFIYTTHVKLSKYTIYIPSQESKLVAFRMLQQNYCIPNDKTNCITKIKVKASHHQCIQ